MIAGTTTISMNVQPLALRLGSAVCERNRIAAKGQNLPRGGAFSSVRELPRCKRKNRGEPRHRSPGLQSVILFE